MAEEERRKAYIEATRKLVQKGNYRQHKVYVLENGMKIDWASYQRMILLYGHQPVWDKIERGVSRWQKFRTAR